MLDKLVLRGVKNIKKVTPRKILDSLIMEDGSFKKKETWVLDTIGTNLMELLSMDNIDVTRTYTNDIQEIYSFLQENFTNKYVEYYNSLERYSSNQNTKNYYILFSIVSQILGLTFLLLLFRNLINENI